MMKKIVTNMDGYILGRRLWDGPKMNVVLKSFVIK